MIAVLSPAADYCFTAEAEDFRADCQRILRARFPAARAAEIFYYLKPSDPERYFIVRIEPAAAIDFVPAIQEFAARRRFTILGSAESRQILRRFDLETFI